MEFKGKKLLFLGATGMICEAVLKAKKMGIFTIVTDYYKNSPAKHIADKSYDISTADIDALFEVCKAEKVDGIFTAYSEFNMHYAQELCERCGFPYYATGEQVKTLTNKFLFKRACERFGVSTVPEYQLDKSLQLEDLKNISYPAIVKPVDSYSGKGISICTDETSLIASIPNAVKASKCGRFMVEKYMSPEQYDVVTSYYSIQNGHIALSSMADRNMYIFGNRRLNTALIYPSKYLGRYVKEIDSRICDMIRGLEIKNGTLFLEGCVNADGFWFWESGFRLCGAQQGIFPAHINNVDIEEMLIRHSITGEMAADNLMEREDPYFKGKFACNGVVFANPGVIIKFSGIQDVRSIPGVLNFSQLLYEGHEIKQEQVGTLNQSVARFHVVADSRDQLDKKIESIYSALTIIDKNGNNMLLKL